MCKTFASCLRTQSDHLKTTEPMMFCLCSSILGTMLCTISAVFAGLFIWQGVGCVVGPRSNCPIVPSTNNTGIYTPQSEAAGFFFLGATACLLAMVSVLTCCVMGYCLMHDGTLNCVTTLLEKIANTIDPKGPDTEGRETEHLLSV